MQYIVIKNYFLTFCKKFPSFKILNKPYVVFFTSTRIYLYD